MAIQVRTEIVHASDKHDNHRHENIDRVKDWLYHQPRFVKELIAGGIAGGAAKTCVAPLERTKILFQTGKSVGGGVPGTLRMLYETEGWQGLFRGNGASILRIVPYAAINYSCYEYFRRLLLQHCLPAVKRLREGESSNTLLPISLSPEIKTPPIEVECQVQEERRLGSAGASTSAPATPQYKPFVNPIWDLFAGSSAGAAAVLMTYPLDLARTRLACCTEVGHSSSLSSVSSAQDVASSTSSIKSKLKSLPRSYLNPTIRSTLLETFTTKGFFGLYHGVHPTLLGILPYAGLKFYCYQSFKHMYIEHQQTLHEASGSPKDAEVNTKPPVYYSLLFGGMAGLFAQTVTYPVDVLRRRMQMQGFMSVADTEAMAAAEKLPGTAETCRIIFKERGWKGFFRGLSINYMKVVPCTAVGFAIYDHMKNYLGLENHI